MERLTRRLVSLGLCGLAAFASGAAVYATARDQALDSRSVKLPTEVGVHVRVQPSPAAGAHWNADLTRARQAAFAAGQALPDR